MSALILDGKTLAAQTEAELSQRVAALKVKNNGRAGAYSGDHPGGCGPGLGYLCEDETECL